MKVLDCKAPDESACPSQSRLAVHCHCSAFPLHDFQETLYYLLRWACPVGEVQLIVADPRLFEVTGVVGLVVEPYNCTHAELLEYWHVVLGSKQHILSKQKVRLSHPSPSRRAS